ncbi:NUDIX hydrolase [Ornithinimicrobium avium]|uniref:NUDIX hydrolase n=1 Tax=Ornithinimicrobium avium TaxID=2283195 RepID=A0A345NQ25_9MICO|nr:NUDIX hydrolase [Ornithinimicrobium avium]AXH97133.1 NUDIX hydrolase [Ornithinimicrobium avium]
MVDLGVVEGPVRDFAMPPVVEEQTRAWLATAEPERRAAVPRPSSTVMILRDRSDGGAGVEVFVLRRASSMPFAPGMVAFPGGGVDPRDADPDVPWAGPTPQAWARRLGTDEAVARELVGAAAREVFEECGVLLAGPSPEEVVADLTDRSWEVERLRVLGREQGFGELLTRLGLVLRSDLLSLRGHWTTPVCEPRRYDTRFFAARLPQGQRAANLTTEAERVAWARPGAVLVAQREGRELLLPPTQVMLEQLAAVEDLDSWLAGVPPVVRIQPWPVERDGALWMRCPAQVAGV